MLYMSDRVVNLTRVDILENVMNFLSFVQGFNSYSEGKGKGIKDVMVEIENIISSLFTTD